MFDKKSDISAQQREKLYCEILYTIKHKIGLTIEGHNDYKNDLYKYAQDVFKMTHDDHERLFALASEVKPPVLILNVEVVEAKQLEAKDANGFSDPYCMLGIVPANRAKQEVNTKQTTSSGSDEEAHKSIAQHSKSFKADTKEAAKEAKEKSSFIKRFSSFRRSEKKSEAKENEKENTSTSTSTSTMRSSFKMKKNKDIGPISETMMTATTRDNQPATYKKKKY